MAGLGVTRFFWKRDTFLKNVTHKGENMNILDKKHEYNLILEEFYECEKYIDNIKNPIEDIERAIPKFLSLEREITAMLNWFDENNVSYTKREMMKGFNDE